MSKTDPGRCTRCKAPIDADHAQEGRTLIQRFAGGKSGKTRSLRGRLCDACWRFLEEWLKGVYPGRTGRDDLDGASILKEGD